MFSATSFNQQQFLLFHLSSKTVPIAHKKPTPFKSKVSKVKQDSQTDTRDNNITELWHINLQPSLRKVISDLNQTLVSPLQRLCAQSLAPKRSQIRPLVIEKDSAEITPANDWRPSYVSGDTFLENKCAPKPRLTPLVQMSQSILDDVRRSLFHNGRQWSFSVQTRGFKTHRSAKAEIVRNPTVAGRIKDALGMSSTEKASVPEAGTERLAKLLQAEDIAPLGDRKHQIKMAFAEGYLAGGSNTGAQTKGSKASRYLKIVQQILTTVIFVAIFVSLMSSTTGSMFRLPLGNQIEVDPEDIHVTFEDVKGVDEAKQELREVVEFLRSPDKFSTLGGKLPKGVLLVGPPGTGKTLLARAVAGEAGVPFFHAAGPEFDEVLVGQGARRVRDLFKAAKDRAPCVVFIDEIDSVGAKRTNSVLHPYANQTINQLLSEMDGFHQNEGVIVLGATNRREDLDPALLRPGRFDVEVNVPLPDFTGRKEILQLYLNRVLSKDINVDMMARGTSGFTGADIENMINQAALRASYDGADNISMKHLESARDKVLMGPERKCRLPDEEANLITAYHEGGHAVVAFYTKHSHPLHKVTIIPRGPSLGHTAYMPEKERYHVTKAQLLAMMDTMMGGRAAEELVFGPDMITSGASSDLKQATSIAGQMVRDWGMSEKIGLRTFGGSNSGEVLGPDTSEQVDVEIKKIMSTSYERAKQILRTHAREHRALAEALIKYETLDAEDIKVIMSGKPLGGVSMAPEDLPTNNLPPNVKIKQVTNSC